MKTIKEIKQVLEQLKPSLQGRFQVTSLGVFGSYVREESTPQSDLDILVELGAPMGLFKFIELENFLSQALETKVDLVMKDALKPYIKERILQEVAYI